MSFYLMYKNTYFRSRPEEITNKKFQIPDLELYVLEFVIWNLIFVISHSWYRGRVARLSSAKAATTVRVCSVPQNPLRGIAGFFI